MNIYKTTRYYIACFILLMVTACVVPPIRISGETVGKTPVTPYNRIYVLANFSKDQGWIASPLANGLNKALTAQGKTVASEFQYLDELALNPGPNLDRARAFRPDGTMICGLMQMQSSSLRGTSGIFQCVLYDSASGKRVWQVKAGFLRGQNTTEQQMDDAAAQIIQQIKSFKII